MKKLAITTSVLFFAGLPLTALADAVEFTSAGTDAEVTAAVNAFRSAIGGINANVPGSFIAGRREINWDAVPDTASAPNLFPGNFLNAGVAPRARGAEFSTPGTGLMCSANTVNPSNAPINFGNIDPSYTSNFRQFSAQRLFAPIDSNITEVKFFIPGQSNTRATASAFGAIFTDVEQAGSTSIQFFAQSGALLHSMTVPPTTNGQGGFSFAGVRFTNGEKIWRIVIRTGTHALGAGVVDGPGVDIVAMDDFVYAEPVTVTDPLVIASGGTDQEVTDAVNAYRTALGTLNPNNPGSVGSGRREINWDAVPDTSASPNDLALDFFNGANPGRARGAVFSTPGTSVQVSADSDNPAGAAPNFANINATYASLFRTFSPQRLFQPIGSNQVTVNFFVPGSATAASVSGFGSVFTDVNLPTGAKIDYFDQRGNLLASLFVPTGSTTEQSFSFLGARFSNDYKCASVRITSGTNALGAAVNENTAGGVDLAVMDDFVYGEPIELPPLCRADINGDGLVNSGDFFDFLIGFFEANADFNNDGFTNSQDFYDFLTQLFVGC